MKRRVMSLFLALLLLMSIAVTATAAETFEMAASVNNETRVITVSGAAPAAWGKRTVTVVVLKPGQENVNLDLADNTVLSSAVAAMDSAVCDEDGKFSMQLQIGPGMPPAANEPAATYTVVLGATGLGFNGAENRKTLSVYSATAIPDAISQLKSAGENLEQAIRSNAELLSLDLSGVFAASGEQVCKFMSRYHAEPGSDAFDTIAKIQETYQLACKLTELLNANASDRVNLLEENAALFGTDTQDEDYTDAKADVAKQYVERVKAELLPDRYSPSGFFAETVAVAVLNKASREEVDSVLEKYKSIFDISTDGDYDKLDSYEVSKALSGKGFITAAEVKEAFENRVEELIGKEEDNEKGGSTGGGGGGGRKVAVSGGALADEPLTPIGSTVKTMPFTDLEQYSWAKASIEELYNKGIISGMSETEFNPSGKLTREQFAKILSLAFNIEQKDSTPFADVDANSWYAPYVAGVYSAEIVRGISASEFGVGQPLSRQDMMVMLWRVLADKKIDVDFKVMDFKDRDEIAEYALDAVDALYAIGAVSGTDMGEIEPARACSRSEAAKIICAVMRYGEVEAR